jgi:hypothetical protein
VLELATAADADHAGQHLDYLANYYPATTPHIAVRQS